MSEYKLERKMEYGTIEMFIKNIELIMSSSGVTWEAIVNYQVKFDTEWEITGNISALFGQYDEKLGWDLLFYEKKLLYKPNAKIDIEKLVHEILNDITEKKVIPYELSSELPKVSSISIIEQVKNERSVRMLLEYNIINLNKKCRSVIEYKMDGEWKNLDHYYYDGKFWKDFDNYSDFHSMCFQDSIFEQLIDYLKTLPNFRARAITLGDERKYKFAKYEEIKKKKNA